MNLNKANSVYFIGIGGIGMSALARYCLMLGKNVFGYDRTRNAICEALEKEGVEIVYDLDLNSLSKCDPNNTLVIYTPAVNKANPLLVHALGNYTCLKRSQLLGEISKNHTCIAVAGTHGKTSTSAILAYLLKQNNKKIIAFVGGIMQDFGSNYLADPEADIMVVEADEFDRSFLHLDVDHAIITTSDPDHLDIYGSEAEFKATFKEFASKVKSTLWVEQKVKDSLELNCEVYNVNDLQLQEGESLFNYGAPSFSLNWNIPGKHNAANAFAVHQLLNSVFGMGNLNLDLKNYQGVYRRFNTYQIKNHVVVDDYAHHPTELEASISALKTHFSSKNITVVFQPHLYSRTKDFLNDFASQLNRVDNLFLLPVYAAREDIIEGGESKDLFQVIELGNKVLCEKSELNSYLMEQATESTVFAFLGAGDIDALVKPFINQLEKEVSNVA